MLNRLIVVGFAIACASCVAPASDEQAVSSPLLEIQFASQSIGPDAPVGWIYAFDRSSGGEDLCVYVWPNGTWSLCAETTAGYYGTLISRGKIADGVALGFPSGILDDSGNLYTAGYVSAIYAGKRIKRPSDE